MRVGDYVFTVATFEPVASGAAKIAFEQAVRSFRHRAATGSLPQSDLPAAADGYTWFVAQPNSFWTALFTVQVPIGWMREKASADWEVVSGNFAPPDAEITSPYMILPELSFEVSIAGSMPDDPHPWWHYPIRDYGDQDGVSCTGDLASDTITPSGMFDSGKHIWDTYGFRCNHVEPCCPAGVSYDVRAAEARVGNIIVSIVALEAAGSGDAESAFKQALRTLTFR